MTKFLYKILTAFILCALCVPCFANNQEIESIVLQNSKTNPKAYTLTIKSHDALKYKRYKINDSAVNFEIKNAKLNDNTSISYDNVSGIESVTLDKTKRNQINIYIQGKSAPYVDIVYDTSANSKNTKSPLWLIFFAIISTCAMASYMIKLFYDKYLRQEESFDDIKGRTLNLNRINVINKINNRSYIQKNTTNPYLNPLKNNFDNAEESKIQIKFTKI